MPASPASVTPDTPPAPGTDPLALERQVCFALSVAVELASQLRGLPPMRLPGLAAPQQMAGLLVAAVLGVGSGPLLAVGRPGGGARDRRPRQVCGVGMTLRSRARRARGR